MSNSLFDDAWQSVEWADGEAETLKAEIEDFRDGEPYSVVAENYPDNSGGEITLTVNTSPELELWARRCGDIVTYLRAALNYACYQIALLDCPGEAHRVEFPVFDAPGKFQQQNRVSGFAQNRFGIIEAVQPYPGRAQELWWLHELARFHRHRLIRPVFDVLEQVRHSCTLIRGDMDDITWDTVPIIITPDRKAVLGRWRNARPAETQIHMEPNALIEIVLNDPLVRHVPLWVLGIKLRQVTREVLIVLEQTLP